MKKWDKKLLVLLFSIIFISSSVLLILDGFKNPSPVNDSQVLIPNPLEIKSSIWTWTSTEVVSTESLNRTLYSSIAVDFLGNIHVAWDDETDYGGEGIDSDICYKYLDANSETWTPVEVISTGLVNKSWEVDIAVDDIGNVYVVWSDETDFNGAGVDDDIFLRYKNASTGLWSPIEVVSTESTDDSDNPRVAIDNYGNPNVIWGDLTNYSGALTDPDIFYKFKNVSTGIWTVTELVSTESDKYSNIASMEIDTSGNVRVVWEDTTSYGVAELNEYDIFYKFKNATSGNWTITEVISTESTGTDDCYEPEIGIDGYGNVHIVWENTMNNYLGSGIDRDIFYRIWNVTSGNWTITEVVSTESDDHSYVPDLAIEANGMIHVVWQDITNHSGCGTDKDIFYKNKNDTLSNWTITQVVSTESSEDSERVVVSIYDRNVHIVWDDLTNYSNSGIDWDVFYKKLEFIPGIEPQLVSKFSINANITSWASGDFNNDGILEIAAFSREVPILYVLNLSGDILWEKDFSVTYGDLPWSGLVTSEEIKVGDITNDSIPEIIVPSSNSTDRLIYAFDGSGGLLWTYNHSGLGQFESIALGDINGDGINDITARSSSDNQIHVIAHNGTVLWTIGSAGSGGRSVHIEPLYNSPNENKIITAGGSFIRTYNNDFTPNWTTSYGTGDELGMEFGDVDGDGGLEVAVQIYPSIPLPGDCFIRVYEESGGVKWTYNYPASYGDIKQYTNERPISIDVDDDDQDEILDLVVSQDFTTIALILFHGENSSRIWHYNFSVGGIAASNVGNVYSDIGKEIIVQINDTIYVFNQSGSIISSIWYNGSYILGPPYAPRPLVCDFDGDGYDEILATNNGTIALISCAEDRRRPSIKVTSSSGDYHNTAPTINVAFSDNVALDNGYYRMDSYDPRGQNTTGWIAIFTNHTSNSFETNLTLPSAVWDPLSDGSHTIYFKCWDKSDNVKDGVAAPFQFYKDTTPPQVLSPTPTNSSYVNSLTPTIQADLSDNVSGVNATSIILRVEGVVRAQNWDGTTLNWSSAGFSDGQVIDVQVEASDNIGNAMITYSWSFTLDITPPTDIIITDPAETVHSQTPAVICRVQFTGAGVNISSAYYAYSTNGSSSPSNWTAVSGVFVDSSCLVPASDGATGYVYLKVDVVPFNQYSLDQNTIRFRVSDLADNELVQTTATVIATAEEGPDLMWIIIIIVGIIAGVVATLYVVVRSRRVEPISKEVKIQEQIFNAFVFSEKVIQLFNDCESKKKVSEIVGLVAKIGKNIEQDLPNLPLDITQWKSSLEQSIDADASLEEQTATNLEFDTLEFLNKASNLIKANLGIFKSAFHNVETINKIESKFTKLNSTIEELERRYAKIVQKYLIVIEKESGTGIFRHNFAETTLDSDLVSGFLTAIQSFGTELTEKESAMKKLAYKDFEIDLNKGRYTTAALLLSGPSSKLLERTLERFVRSFEQTYEHVLKDWRGDISTLEDASKLVFLFFEA